MSWRFLREAFFPLAWQLLGEACSFVTATLRVIRSHPLRRDRSFLQFFLTLIVLLVQVWHRYCHYHLLILRRSHRLSKIHQLSLFEKLAKGRKIVNHRCPQYLRLWEFVSAFLNIMHPFLCRSEFVWLSTHPSFLLRRAASVLPQQ
jgi:hypothetical protein